MLINKREFSYDGLIDTRASSRSTPGINLKKNTYQVIKCITKEDLKLIFQIMVANSVWRFVKNRFGIRSVHFQELEKIFYPSRTFFFVVSVPLQPAVFQSEIASV